MPDTVWYGQIAPTDVYPADFRGEVLHADIGGVPARTGQMPELHAALRAPTVGARALVSGAERTPRLASVISVLDEHRAEVLVLGQEGDAARFRFRLRTADARFRTPSVRLDGALVSDAHGPTELAGFRSPGRLSLSSATFGELTQATIALGPGLGWALLLPFDIGLTPAVAEAGTAAFAAVVLLLVGYYAGMSLPHRSAAATGLAFALAALGLWGAPIVFPEATVAASEAVAATVGAITGTLAAMGVSRRVRRRDQSRR